MLMVESIRAFSGSENPLPSDKGPYHASMCTVLYPAPWANCHKVGLPSASCHLFGKSDCRIPNRNIILDMTEQLPPEIATPKLTKWLVDLRKGVVLWLASFNER